MDTWRDAWRVILAAMDPIVTVRLLVILAKVVETSRLETRATEFVLYASVLHANEECEAKAIFTQYLSQSLRGGRGVRAYRMRPERW